MLKEVKCNNCDNVMMPGTFAGFNKDEYKIFGFQCFGCGNIIYVNWELPKKGKNEKIQD